MNDHEQALNRLQDLVMASEGCPVPTEACSCSGEDCIIAEILRTAPFPNPVDRPKKS